MFRKLIVLICLLSFFPAAAGAQDLALLNTAQPAQELTTAQTQPTSMDLSAPMPKDEAFVVAANEYQSAPVTEARPRKTHTGLTFQEFVDVHFGGHRWVYWALAVAGIVAIHVVAAD